jgi:hypothetical protein
MTTLRDLLEVLGQLPPYTLDHPVRLAITEQGSPDGSLWVDLQLDGVALVQHWKDAAEYPVGSEAIDERLAKD